MRLLPVFVFVLLAGCGPALQGNWNFAIDSTNPCAGSMALGENRGEISGGYACTFANGAGIQGGVTGQLSADDVSLVLSATGYQGLLVTATVRGETMSGTTNGSGYSNASFSASRP